ncbi:MAG: diguanylate cyclase [Pseudomonadota bacterium]
MLQILKSWLITLPLAARIGAVALIPAAFVLLAGAIGWALLDRGDIALRQILSDPKAAGGSLAGAADQVFLLAEYQRASFLVLFLTLLGGSLAAVSLVTVVALATTRAIERTADHMTLLAKGDFEIELPSPGRSDEIGAMEASLRHFAVAMREVSEARDRMWELSISDPLTKLVNRRGLDGQIGTLLTGEEPISILTVMHVDLDHFKAVNDTFGHDAGDHVLMVASRRMQAAVRDNDTVARVGGDEFVILLPGLDDLARLAQIASHLIGSLTKPIEYQGRICQIGASIGIATGGAYHDATDPERLLKDADLAVFQSKARGRGRFSVFDRRMRSLMEHQQRTAMQLRAALDQGWIEAWVQPVLDPVTGRALSVEALARWRDPKVGLVAAEDFVEVARQRNLLSEIGSKVLDQASDGVAGWPSGPGGLQSLSVNFSATELADPNVIDRIRWSLDRSGLAPERLVAEARLAVLDDRGVERVLANLSKLRSLGAGVLIDGLCPLDLSSADFDRIPATAVKLPDESIDRVMADASLLDQMTQAIHLLKSRGLVVYAKGLARRSQVETARRLEVDGLQGYAVCEPLEISTCQQRFFTGDSEARTVANV